MSNKPKIYNITATGSTTPKTACVVLVLNNIRPVCRMPYDGGQINE